jgi:hypothetical protein
MTYAGLLQFAVITASRRQCPQPTAALINVEQPC